MQIHDTQEIPLPIRFNLGESNSLDPLLLSPNPVFPGQSGGRSGFLARIQQEFLEGSAIDPELFKAAVQIVPELLTQPGGEVEAPIHAALNWHYTRFTHQAKTGELWAALLVNEDGSTWQAKLSHPRIDPQKTLKALRQRLGQPVTKAQVADLLNHYPETAVPQKYETAVGQGAKAYLPPIPAPIRQHIAARYQITIPDSGSFWQWLSQHPEVPVVLTEGGKKSLSLLSLGYVAIALCGVSGGYRSKDNLGYPVKPHLIPEIQTLCQYRSLTLAFDQDRQPKTRHTVALAIRRFSHLLIQSGSTPQIAEWEPHQGKGVDDLIANQGAEFWQQIYTSATPFEHWQIWQRLDNRLTYPAHLNLTTADLSTLSPEQIPDSGIIGLAAAKGTGKTKWIAQTVADRSKVLSAGHRITLMRNLALRLNLDYRGDLDKVDGQFFNGCGYALRVGFCVDALLAIDPEQFAGCDLVIDEFVQVLRHLLTSPTCAKDGKRPALLSRFQQLVQLARRVIVADADLDNASLHYLQTLRQTDAHLFLIRNDYQPQGYPVRFLEAPDRGSITQDLLQAVQQIPDGQVLYVATDSKAFSKTLNQLISQHSPSTRVLLINADTSSGLHETLFIQEPDTVLSSGEYDVIIASPSVATGVSIEVQGMIAQVYGIFIGASSTDADMAQALGRVREPVERVVWCAVQGHNFCKVSRSCHPIQLKRYLLDQTTTTVSLIRSSLKADVAGAVNHCDWQADPHIHLYAQISAEQNFAMQHLRTALLVRLKHEGNQVTLEQPAPNPAMRLLISSVRNRLHHQDAEVLVNAKVLSYLEATQLEQKESLSLEEQQALARYYLCDFYGLDPHQLTPEFVLWDRKGNRRSELLSLEAQLHHQLSVERDIKALERQTRWFQGLCPWDLSHAELRQSLREKLGLNDFLNPALEWTEYDLEPYAERARALATQIQVGLKFTIPTGTKGNGRPKMSNVQIVHQLLSQLGLKVTFRWSRSVAGHQGKKLRVYRLDAEHWQQISTILERRQAKRKLESSSVEFKPVADQVVKQVVKQVVRQVLIQRDPAAPIGSPPALNIQTSQGDPVTTALYRDSSPLSTQNLGTQPQPAQPNLQSALETGQLREYQS